jgi:hypothetical protein
MPSDLFQPCIPTRAIKVPTGPDWIHEIKHDGYRLIVQKDQKRVRLFTRNGHDWTDRYPLIVEAALRNRPASFVIDGEAVLLGVGFLCFLLWPAKLPVLARQKAGDAHAGLESFIKWRNALADRWLATTV